MRALWTIGLVVGSAAIVAACLGAAVLAKGAAWAVAKWQHPAWLVPAIVVPPIVVWAMSLGAEPRTPALRVSTIAPLAAGPRGLRARIRWLPAVLRGAALCLAMAALARPENLVKPEESTERGIDIVIVLDLSGSMRAVMDQAVAAPTAQAPKTAQRPTRLDVAKSNVQFNNATDAPSKARVKLAIIPKADFNAVLGSSATF
jgi:Ca-activated chloride channel family protein